MCFKLFPLVFVFLTIACEQQSSNELAIVNGRVVTGSDFVFAYETSPSAMLSGPRDQVYHRVLNSIIDKILLTQAAEEQGLDDQPQTASELKSLEAAAIRRELFRRHVRLQVKVTDQDCRAAYQKAQQTLWIQHAVFDSTHWVNPGRWDPKWELVAINSSCKTRNTKQYGLVNLITWNDLDQQLEDLLYSLSLGEVSQPLRSKGVIHLFRLVNSETNNMTSENSYVAEREHFQTAIRKRAEHALAFEYVQEIMQPQHLLIHRDVLEQLTGILWQRRLVADSLEQQRGGEVSFADADLDDLDDLELASFKTGRLLIKDFRFEFKMNPLELSRSSVPALRQNLINAIGIYVRNIVFAAQGNGEQLGTVPAVIDDNQYWREQLLAAKMEASIQQVAASPPAGVSKVSKRQPDLKLSELLVQLRGQAAIDINENLLQTIRTSDTGLPHKIDFFASYLN